MKFIVLIMLLLLVGIAAAQQIPTAERIVITLVTQEPEPAEPGDTVKIKFRIENEGSKIVTDFQVELLEEFPFTLVEDSIKEIGTLEGRQIGTAGVTIEYRVQVSAEASEGNNELKLRYRSGKQDWVLPEEFIVRIESTDAFLSIDNIETNPPTIVPGQTASLTFDLKNTAGSLLRDIDLTLNFTGSDTPFVPIESSSIKKLNRVYAGETGQITFQITALPSASAGIYKVPVQLSYSDEAGNSFVKNSIIGLKVGSEPDLTVTVDSAAACSGEVSLKIVNKGLADLKLMNAVLLETPDYTISSKDEEYIGNIDSDDYENVEFSIECNKNYVELKLQLEYLDANNVRYNEEYDIPMKVSKSKTGIGKKIIGYLIVITIVAVGIWYYKRKHKKKK